MKTEKHIVNKTYGGHQLARYVDVYELSAVDCHATQYSGYRGTEITLVDNPPAGYNFSHWDITGATLTGNNFIMNNDVTAQGIYTVAPHIGTVSINSTDIGPTREVMIPLADSNGTNRNIVANATTANGNLGWNKGRSEGSLPLGYIQTGPSYKAINSGNQSMSVSAQITAGNLGTWTAQYATTAYAQWVFRLAGMKYGSYTYSYTGFGNSYMREYRNDGSQSYPTTYTQVWNYNASKDGTLLTATIPAGYVPVIVASYNGYNDQTYNSGCMHLNYTWKYTAVNNL